MKSVNVTVYFGPLHNVNFVLKLLTTKMYNTVQYSNCLPIAQQNCALINLLI
jgi:hypothetical protein